jgi:hypothetical protein
MAPPWIALLIKPLVTSLTESVVDGIDALGTRMIAE